MILELNSSKLNFRYQLQNGRWLLKTPSKIDLWIASAPICLLWHTDRTRDVWLSDRGPSSQSTPDNLETDFGDCSYMLLGWRDDTRPIGVDLEIQLLRDSPLLLWRTTIKNLSPDHVYLDRITMLHAGNPGPPLHKTASTLPDLFLKTNALSDGGASVSATNDALAFYTNGWQSWNYAGTLSKDDQFPRTRLGPLAEPMRLSKGSPRLQKGGHFHSDMFAILGDRNSRRGWLAGYLSQDQAFGLLEGWVGEGPPAMRMWSELDGVRLMPGVEFVTDWAALELVDLDKFPTEYHYINAVSIQNDVRVRHQAQTGWCSWYHAFEGVTQDHLRQNVDWVKQFRDELPLELIQLDDGFEQKVGDWFEFKDSFPGGLEGVSETISQSGNVPGLWLSPFVASRNSTIARDHPDWILRNRFGIPVNPGFLWNSFPAVLDITRSEVQDYIAEVIKKCVDDLGYKYLKLDFLYAGALDGKRSDPDITRAQALKNTFSIIREAAGLDTKILGCGCPIGSGIGIFDYMRINPDVAPHWLPQYAGINVIFNREEGLPGAKNALLTAINRSFMHNKWWINDPDCLLIRDTETELTVDEVQTLATVIALSAGSIIVSDHMPALSSERVDWFAKMLPPLPQAAQILDWFDTPTPSRMMIPLKNELGVWHLLGLINWGSEPSDMVIDLEKTTGLYGGSFHMIDFWNEVYTYIDGSTLHFSQIPPHGIRFVSLRKVIDGPQWVGSTLHTSQGLFVDAWNSDINHLSAEIDLQRKGMGDVWLQIPNTPKDVSFNGEKLYWEKVSGDIIRARLRNIREGKLVVGWE
jgi:alpha-galactosidase